MTRPHSFLHRELGIAGATFMGLGAMMGTGVFVSIGVAAGVGGPSVIPALLIAALVAVCNGLSSAQLAASHAVSGGTYEYGYRYLTPSLGFTAGWMFLCAKSASAATAALGFSGYFLRLFPTDALTLPALGVAASVGITLLVGTGMKRSNAANWVIVSITLLALLIFAGFALPAAAESEHLSPLLPQDSSAVRGFLEACALLFVAYTGYGRIATMGEEIRNPEKNIPRAILWVMVVTAAVYLTVGVAAIGAVGADQLGEAARQDAAPLESVLQTLGHPDAARLVGIGAMTAMLGVLLNLVLGLSRVALAMGRRGDLPGIFGELNAGKTTPIVAVAGAGALITMLVLLGNVKLTWSFSAFTVLIYYALTNLAALRLPEHARLYPRAFAWCGLASCLFLAFWVDIRIWCAGLVVIAAGLAWHFLMQRLRAQP